MADLSPKVVEAWFTAANWSAVGGALLVLLGTAGMFYFGRMRDRQTYEHISNNERETAEARLETERIKGGNAQLQLQLEKEHVQRLLLEEKVTPRHLSAQQKAALISMIRMTGWKKAEIIWVGNGEPESYARDLASAFEQAGTPVNVHTLGPFIPSAWGLLVVKTANGDSSQLKAILDDTAIPSEAALTNDILGVKQWPTLVVGARKDTGASR